MIMLHYTRCTINFAHAHTQFEHEDTSHMLLKNRSFDGKKNFCRWSKCQPFSKEEIFLERFI